MNEGWYAIANIEHEYTLHFVVLKDDSTLCQKYTDLSNLEDDRILDSTLERHHVCTLCEKALKRFLETGMTPTERRKKSMDSKSDKTRKKLKQTIDKLTSKLSENKEGDWRNTICPSCKTPVIFFNKSRKKEHYCTVCKNLVTLPMVAVAI